MIAKELLENRWKLVAGIALAVAVAILNVYTYELVRNLLSNANTTQLPPALASQFENLGDYNAYLWSQWFGKTGVQLLNVFAILFGASLIAGEVSKGTIYLLLSRPVSRERILFLKYAVSGGILFVMGALGGAALLLASALNGHFLNVGGVLLSTLLIWLGSLLVLGVALVFSILLDDTLRAVAAAAGVMAVIAIMLLVPGLDVWSPAHYWTSLPVYLGAEFPAVALLVNLLFAALPLALAVWLFHRHAY